MLALVASGLIWYTGTLDHDLPEAKPTAKSAQTPSVASSTAQPPKAATPAGAAATPARKLFVKVANTGGQGANLRSAAGASAPRLDALLEGTVLEVVGPDVQLDGLTWKNVKDSSGRVGWMAADFLVPTEP